MRSLGVVVLSPTLDDDLGLPERVADLTEDIQGAERFALVSAAMRKAIAPDVVPIFGPELETGSVVQPEPFFPRLFRWHP